MLKPGGVWNLAWRTVQLETPIKGLFVLVSGITLSVLVFIATGHDVSFLRMMMVVTFIIAHGLTYRVVVRLRREPWGSLVFQNPIRPAAQVARMLVVLSALLCALVLLWSLPIAVGAVFFGGSLGHVLGGTLGAVQFGTTLLIVGAGVSTLVRTHDAEMLFAFLSLSMVMQVFGSGLVPSSLWSSVELLFVPYMETTELWRTLAGESAGLGAHDVAHIVGYPIAWSLVVWWRVASLPKLL